MSHPQPVALMNISIVIGQLKPQYYSYWSASNLSMDNIVNEMRDQNIILMGSYSRIVLLDPLQYDLQKI